MKIRAAILEDMGRAAPYAVSKPLTISAVDLAPPGPGEVMVKMRAAGLCHSDLSVIDGSRPRTTPMALGHEASATVEDIGAGVDDLAKGDPVVLCFVPSCGHCNPCAGGIPSRRSICLRKCKSSINRFITMCLFGELEREPCR